MRHRRNFNHLSRKSAHRKSMLANMAVSLIIHKRIHTTLAKAKALRTYVEPLITKSKEDTTHSRRVVFSYLQSKDAVTELFREVSVKVAERPGGYTRIIKTGARLGDNAEMCMIELVDFNENLLGDKGGKAKTSRRRRGGKKKADEILTSGAAAVSAGEEEKPVEPKDDATSEVDSEKPTETETEDTDETPVIETEAKSEEKKEEGKPVKDESEQVESVSEITELTAEEPAKEAGTEGSEEKIDDTKSESK